MFVCRFGSLVFSVRGMNRNFPFDFGTKIREAHIADICSTRLYSYRLVILSTHCARIDSQRCTCSILFAAIQPFLRRTPWALECNIQNNTWWFWFWQVMTSYALSNSSACMCLLQCLVPVFFGPLYLQTKFLSTGCMSPISCLPASANAKLG